MAVRRIIGAMRVGKAVKKVVQGEATPAEAAKEAIEGGVTALGGAVVGRVARPVIGKAVDAVDKAARNPETQEKAKQVAKAGAQVAAEGAKKGVAAVRKGVRVIRGGRTGRRQEFDGQE